MRDTAEFNLDNYVALSLKEISRILKNAEELNRKTAKPEHNKPFLGAAGGAVALALTIAGSFGVVKNADDINLSSVIPNMSSTEPSSLSHPITEASLTSTLPEKWTPQENSEYDDNGLIRLWPNQDLPGVINLLEKDSATGEWRHYNNIVPVAAVTVSGKLNYSNTEMEKASPTRTVIVNPDGTKSARYQYPRLKNGAHFFVDIALETNEKEVKATLGINNDSARIEEIALGNFLGIASGVRYVNYGTATLDARNYPDPQDGHFRIGSFRNFPMGNTDMVKFWGPNGEKQYQKIEGSSAHYLSGEIRRRAWMPHMDDEAAKIGANWWEAVQTFAISPKNGIIWTFGIEDPNLVRR